MQRNGLQQRSDEVDGQPILWPESEHADVTDGNPLGLKDLPSPPPPRLLRWLGLFTFVLLTMGMLATLAVVTIASEKKTSLLEAEEKRLQESVYGRVSVLTLPLPRSLRDQQPYFQQLMADFSRQHNLVRATILREDGAILMSSRGPALFVADILRRLEDKTAERKITLSPIRRLGDQDGALVVDMIMDFPRSQVENDVAKIPQAYLVLTLPIGQILKNILTNRAVESESEHITLLQKQNDKIDRLWMTPNGLELATSPLSDGLLLGAPVAFGRRHDDAPVYSLGEPVKSTPWMFYHSLDARTALSPVHDFIKVVAGLSAMAVLALTIAFIALWWRQDGNHHRQLVDFYRAHAQRVARQRQFLQSVTTSISDWLTVSSPEGELIYANPAFEAVIGQPGLSLSGCRWDDFVKEESGVEPRPEDILGLIDPAPFDIVEIAGDRRVISSGVSSMHAEDGRIQGTVRVVRDHTDVVAERRRRLLSLSQTVDAFVHAIELRDPFLLGHTERVRTHAIAIGKRLGLSTNDLANLALAASLSQIGKIFIPDDILKKPDRHDPEEGKVMRDHILRAADILKRIDFETPIVDVLVQMHERLDGTGYPFGIAGAEISLAARILAVADVYCARTAPRSYRDRLSAGKTLYHLASNDRRYDLKVVAALAEFVGHDQEAEELDTIEQTFIDAAIWQRKQCENDRVHESA